jgi:hypothetical protein
MYIIFKTVKQIFGTKSNIAMGLTMIGCIILILNDLRSKKNERRKEGSC